MVDAVGIGKRYGPVVAVQEVSFYRSGWARSSRSSAPTVREDHDRQDAVHTGPADRGAGVGRGFRRGQAARAVRRRIGLIFPDDQLTAEQNLRFHAMLYHVPRAQSQGHASASGPTVGLQQLPHRDGGVAPT
ncbi:hypothetical protein AB0M41_31805 [Streptomyces sp. NPDC051896]|uniref:hypothetical protein n=1 Tax=Streptomyces sp. NPDC051896 TaxID=3155416 RepID=UPI00342EA363